MAKATKNKRPTKGKKKPPQKKAQGKSRRADKRSRVEPALSVDGGCEVLDRLWRRIEERRTDPSLRAHSARLLARGTQSVLQKLGEELVEFMIEAIADNRRALVLESADVLYHLMIAWVNAGVRPDQVWAELEARERASLGAAEPPAHTTKIP